MAKKVLTDVVTRRIKAGDAPISDGTVGGLVLKPSAKVNGQGAWSLTYKVKGADKREKEVIGHYPQMGIAEARRVALEIKEKAFNGISYRAEKRTKEEEKQKEAANTVESVCRAFYAAGIRAKKWKNPKDVEKNFIGRFERYVFPLIGNEPIGTIKAKQITKALTTPISPLHRGKAIIKPLEECKGIAVDSPPVCKKILDYLNQVFKYAEARELRDTGNPMGAVRTELALTHKKKRIKGHYPSLPIHLLPRFVKELVSEGRGLERTSAAALLFVILTACRSGAARMAAFKDVNLEHRIWTLEGGSTLSKTEHTVCYPITPAALRLIEMQIPEGVSETTRSSLLVFNGRGTENKPLGNMAMTKLMRDMAERHEWIVSDVKDEPPVPHGFRATFKGWSIKRGYDDRLSERQLAHVVGDETQQAYDREALAEERRAIMEEWEQYVLSEVGGKI